MLVDVLKEWTCCARKVNKCLKVEVIVGLVGAQFQSRGGDGKLNKHDA